MTGPAGAPPEPPPGPPLPGPPPPRRSAARWLLLAPLLLFCACPVFCVGTHLRASAATHDLCLAAVKGSPIEDVRARARAASLRIEEHEPDGETPARLRAMATGGLPGAGASGYTCVVEHDGTSVIRAIELLPED